MRRSSLLALTGLLGGLVAVLPAAPALAEDVYERPADGTYEVEGHGWGHGRGMSQWGAQGAASQGRSADDITSTYYPGTQRVVLPDSAIRVWLSADEGRDTDVFAAPGLKVTDVASGATAVLPAGPARWRAVLSGSGLQLQSLTDATWTAHPLDGRTELAGPLRFGGPEFVRVQLPAGHSRDYRGAVQAVRTGSSLRTVDVLSLEDYLLGVVPRESSASWRPAALQAQAIAARSYSVSKRSRVTAGATYDICDTTTCQVFAGSRLYSSSGRATELEPATTTEAVRATRGVIRALNGKAVHAEFSSSNGGWSTSGFVSYLPAREDPWDGALPNPVHGWKAALPVSALEQRFPAVGTLTRVRVTHRDGNGDWGGRVKAVVLEGVKDGRVTSVSTTGAAVHQARSWPASSDGLRSAWWRLSGGGAPSAPPSAPAGTPDSAVHEQSGDP
ncbi:MAG: hypothetical protein JWN57_1394, partial [Frankiales bacterium]|nr:hypothetical protein [Frankiales bacterium]